MSYNDTTVDDISYNDTTVDDMSYNDVTVDDMSSTIQLLTACLTTI